MYANIKNNINNVVVIIIIIIIECIYYYLYSICSDKCSVKLLNFSETQLINYAHVTAIGTSSM